MTGNFGGSWYNDNNTRAYPLVDGPVIDDSGQALPTDLIADLKLIIPDTIASVGLLGLTVGPSLITLAIGTPEISETVTAVAVAAVPRSTQPGQMIAMTSLVSHVGGWVVFGTGLEKAVIRQYKFSTPIPFAARSICRYPAPPVTSISKQRNVATLRGVVRLSGGNDVEVVSAQRQLDGVHRTVAVIRLSTDRTVQAGRNLFEVYRGECGQRPESGTCNRPGIQRLGTAVPDCAGNIDILFGDPFSANPNGSNDGIEVDFPYGLADACGPKPFETDQVPGEVSDSCAPSELPSYTREFSYSSEPYPCP